MELPHDRRPDALHDGPSRAGIRAAARRRSQSCRPRGSDPAPRDRETGEGCEAGREEGTFAQGRVEGGEAAGRPRRESESQSHKEEVALPYLRFSRDKHGYENTYVVHTGRQRGRSRSRVLYWFRTPPGVRVGRSALDEDAIRLIEANNPDLEFDWTSILKGQDASSREPAAAPQNERRGRRTREPVPPSRQQSTGGASTPQQERVAPVQPAPLAVQSPGEPPGHAEGPSETLAATAAVARLGAEGVVRLRARHAEVLARISEKITDPVGRDELKAQAERLNPDTWVTAAEVSAGLESYESVFELLRGVVGRCRQRRRPRGGQPGSPDQPVTAGDSAVAAEDGAPENGEAPGE